MGTATVGYTKERNVHLMDLENYRKITLCSVFARVFDLVVLNHCCAKLNPCELQFGFKQNRSTAIPRSPTKLLHIILVAIPHYIVYY